jgi:BirA family biotin operon repressor/biotin-[acetyl-CoA-carboxylase] ligase
VHRPLNQSDLLAHAPLRRLGACVLLFDRTDSTNRRLLEAAAELPDGTIASAESQTAGRGRMGRAWHCPRGAGLLISVLLHERDDAPLLRLSTTLAALAAVEAVRQTTECAPVLRWPNDIYLDARKLGGVLCETTPLGGARRALVIGVGINCLQQPAHFPPELRERATSLEIASSRAVDRAALAGALIARLDARLAEVATGGGAERLLADWAGLCADVGQAVRLVESGVEHAGRIVALRADGGLLVELDAGGRRHFAARTTTRVG